MKIFLLLISVTILHSCGEIITNPKLQRTLIIRTDKENYIKRNNTSSEIINIILYNGYDTKIQYYNPVYALLARTNTGWECLKHTDIAPPGEIGSKCFVTFTVSLNNLQLAESDTFKYICSYRIENDLELYTCETNEFTISVN